MAENNELLRQKNLDAIEQYLSMRGKERYSGRLPLYAEDVVFEMVYVPEVHHTKEELVKQAAAIDNNEILDVFPDWGFYDYEGNIYSSNEDPNRFMVECIGKGMYHHPKIGEPKYYENHFVLGFEMQDGKIKKFREFADTCELFKVYGLEVPSLEPFLGKRKQGR